jgi:GTP cyclohydrolase II
MSESSQHELTVERYAEARLPTRFGPFRVVVYRELGAADKEHLAVIAGEVADAEDLLIRVHSECLTGEVLHSLKCDCRDQLDLALQRIRPQGAGPCSIFDKKGAGLGSATRSERTQSKTKASTRSMPTSPSDSRTISVAIRWPPTCSAIWASAPSR